jgi:dihydroorotate dehydrogenase (fumarate)
MRYVIGGVGVNSPIMVGAGACKTPASILPYMRSDISVGAVSTGSYTPHPRLGNEGTLFWPNDFGEFMRNRVGLNSFGMPNFGFESASKEFRSTYERPVIASIAGFSVDEYLLGVKIFDALPGIAAIKANFGCPNVQDQKPVPIAYDLDSLLHILEAIKQVKLNKPIWLKLSPYITAEQRSVLQNTYPHINFTNVPVVPKGFLGDVLSIILEFPELVRAVVFSNTLPNVIMYNEKRDPVTTPNGGKAGLSGSILKRISIDLIHQARMMLPGQIDLIGSGGVLHGDDVVDYIEAGAAGVFCTSAPFWSGNDPRFFSDMLSESERLQQYLI